MKLRLRLPLLLALIATLGMLATDLLAQDLHPSRRASPMAQARTHVGDAYVSVVYSRPYKRDRDNIFGSKDDGAIIPYGEVWRTGANEATEFTTTGDLMVGGKKLPAGTYSLFTVPNKDSWSIHFNSALGLWGTIKFTGPGEYEPGYKADNDVAVVEAKPSTLEEEVDQFTIKFRNQDDGSVHMILEWITTEVRVPLTAG